MKKHIFITAALLVTSLNALFAQSEGINANATKSFERKFVGATNVQWQQHPKGIALAQFRYQDETCLAYFNPEGDIISSGRKVKSPDLLPLQVKESLAKVQSKYEAKYGTFTFGVIFEMVSDSGTEYYIPLETDNLNMMVSINSAGSSEIRSKVHRLSPTQPRQSAIAKN